MASHAAAAYTPQFINGFSLFNSHELCDSVVWNVVLDQTRGFNERAHTMLRSKSKRRHTCRDDDHKHRRQRPRIEELHLVTPTAAQRAICDTVSLTLCLHKRRSPSIATALTPTPSERESQLSAITDCDRLLTFLAQPAACDDTGDAGFAWDLGTAR